MTRARRQWWLVAAAAAIVYVSSFFVVKYSIVLPYELSQLSQHHWLRPVYERVYFPMRLLDANSWSPFPRAPRIRAGKVLEVTQKKLVFDEGESIFTASFVCTPDACAELQNVKPGHEIEATFGAALVPGRDTFVNKLLAVRKCVGDMCVAAYARQRVETAQLQEWRQAADQQSKECIDAMERTLASDGRYVAPPTRAEAKTRVEESAEQYNVLLAEKRPCLEAVVKNHRRAVFEACELHKCGDNIGGGCWHIADPLPAAVTAKAVEKCGS